MNKAHLGSLHRSTTSSTLKDHLAKHNPTKAAVMRNGASSGRMALVTSPRRSRTCWSRTHHWQGRGLSCQIVVQTGQRPQKSGSGLVHFAHRGTFQMPLRAWATVPQPLQVIHRCWHRSHQGWPVARDSSQSVVLPQMPHSAVILGRQLLQRGPSGSRFDPPPPGRGSEARPRLSARHPVTGPAWPPTA
ncbi:hypothetical protein SALBM135S_05573 [Streptomyces alboniger]